MKSLEKIADHAGRLADLIESEGYVVSAEEMRLFSRQIRTQNEMIDEGIAE